MGKKKKDEYLTLSADEGAIMEEKNFKKEVFPKEVYILPLIRRPFFPGMAVPILIEPGKYYEVLKEAYRIYQFTSRTNFNMSEKPGVSKRICVKAWKRECVEEVKSVSCEEPGLSEMREG